MSNRVGVILSGCGVQDGSEIYETTLTLLALSMAGAEAVCMAPSVVQRFVINHLTGEEMPEKRNVLIESSRLARGVIEDIDDVEAKDLDALILPGGYGAAKNLSTFAFDSTDCQVHPEVERLVREMHEGGKPVGAICIAPALVGKILEGEGVRLTLGTSPEMRNAMTQLGHKYMDCEVDEICVDEKNKIVTTPAYMLAESIAEAWSGIEKLVNEVLRLINEDR